MEGNNRHATQRSILTWAASVMAVSLFIVWLTSESQSAQLVESLDRAPAGDLLRALVESLRAGAHIPWLGPLN